MPDPVVITRPLAQAAELERRVAALGRATVIFPLLDILPLSDPAPLQHAMRALERYALVAFVSPNAIDAAFAARPDWPRGPAIAVMGEGSRQALARHGVTEAHAVIHSPRDPARTDSETLLQTLDLHALRGRRVLIVRGESGRELLGDALRAAGAQVETVAAYRRAAPAFDPARRRALLTLLRQGADWIVTSSEALRNLAAMASRLEEIDGVAKMQQQRLFVPHARIAETARELGCVRIVQSRPGDEGLLAALQSCP